MLALDRLERLGRGEVRAAGRGQGGKADGLDDEEPGEMRIGAGGERRRQREPRLIPAAVVDLYQDVLQRHASLPRFPPNMARLRPRRNRAGDCNRPGRRL